MSNFAPIIIPVLVFGAVGGLIFLLGQYYATQTQTHRRLQIASNDLVETGSLNGLHAFVERHFDERIFRLTGERREKLRRELLKAGYFHAYALNYYIFARIAALVLIPGAIYLLLQFLSGEASPVIKLVAVAASGLIAFLGPDAYIARRQRILSYRYRLIFPDFLDLLLVCVDAGLGVEAAFTRVTGQILRQNWELGMNLELMGAEIRAGRSLIQALQSLSDRLGLDEAASLTTMLRQSIEFGSDVADALRVFSDEMRDKRLLRAEETANKLSVKMVLPLGIFIFPVVLMVIMLPVVIKLMSVLH
ncbi:MAG TPA: type II secretion system F family protein [Pseudolabrys sp.]|nr:type II secretion system F family protein [Pseudolabrys sp.]